MLLSYATIPVLAVHPIEQWRGQQEQVYEDVPWGIIYSVELETYVLQERTW